MQLGPTPRRGGLPRAMLRPCFVQTPYVCGHRACRELAGVRASLADEQAARERAEGQVAEAQRAVAAGTSRGGCSSSHQALVQSVLRGWERRADNKRLHVPWWPADLSNACPLAFLTVTVAELEAALAARDAQLAAAQEAQRSSMAMLSTRGRSTVGEVWQGMSWACKGSFCWVQLPVLLGKCLLAGWPQQ